jgi:hypothetical protein
MGLRAHLTTDRDLEVLSSLCTVHHAHTLACEVSLKSSEAMKGRRLYTYSRVSTLTDVTAITYIIMTQWLRVAIISR